MKFYAVANGRRRGIYTSIDDYNQQTHGFSGYVGKSFKTYKEALEFMYEANSKMIQAYENFPQLAGLTDASADEEVDSGSDSDISIDIVLHLDEDAGRFSYNVNR
jgi:viroplasmin and RNaseH domain-containing protein